MWLCFGFTESAIRYITIVELEFPNKICQGILECDVWFTESLNSKETQQTCAICNKSSVKFFREKQALGKCGRSCEEAHAAKFLFAK